MSKRPVLIVEDDKTLRESIAMILDDEEFPVWKAADGREALGLLTAAAELPGLILLDVHMPIMDASAFVREMQQNATLAQVPIVIITASAMQGMPPELANLTSLRKPMAAHDLVALARTFCGG